MCTKNLIVFFGPISIKNILKCARQYSGQSETNGINIATNTTAITKMCACLNAAFEVIGGDAQAVWEECEGNPCIG